MFKIESHYIDSISNGHSFSSREEALEYAVEQMQGYVKQFIEEFVDIERVSIKDDPDAFIYAVRQQEIDSYDFADALEDYVDQVQLERSAYLQRIQVLQARNTELEEQLKELRQGNQEAQS